MEHLAGPAAPLAPFVRCYVQLAMRLPGQPVVLPIPARSAPVLEFTLGDPNLVVFTDKMAPHEIAHAVNVVGVQTHRRVQLSMRGNLDTFVVVFQPGGLSSLLSVSADLLTDRHFDGRAVCGAWVGDLWNRLGESASFAERVRNADHCLLQRCPAANVRGDVNWAARALLTGSGRRMSDLVATSGLSARQFERRFVSQVGMPPKVYARVARFEAALKKKKQAPELRWTDVALEVGYYDHMHMVHDFHLLAGAAPSIIAPEVDRIVVDQSERSGRSGVQPERVSLHPLLS